MKAFSTAALLALCACLAFGQGATSLMNGSVTDPTGAAVPGAEVQATQTDTNLVLKVTTNGQGEFAIPSVPAGPYQIVVTKPGFKTATVSNIHVESGVPATVPVKLEVGQTSESVTVTAGAEIVQATSAEVTSTLSGRQVVDLPFATRNAVELMVTQPGTSTPTNPRSSTINGLPKGVDQHHHRRYELAGQHAEIERRVLQLHHAFGGFARRGQPDHFRGGRG